MESPNPNARPSSRPVPAFAIYILSFVWLLHLCFIPYILFLVLVVAVLGGETHDPLSGDVHVVIM